ncbi:AfsR/SARP family transcriptional regulator [Nocardiopsis halophila]|uniref:AfsR/SARP family transcriptional regulator n=1 Tax=Nocardiopsis halophila TaxID=141692 RepID=UPI00058597E1|nr:BTAD domain-containing putative transcriptional regulator [Nocardiopsis halophila]
MKILVLNCQTLGALEIGHGDKRYSPSGPKARQVLALLLLNANSVVAHDAIVDELWRDSPPRSVSTTLQTYIYQLRKAFRGELSESGLSHALVTSAPGYKLRIPQGTIDSDNFELLAREGRQSFESGRYDEAHGRLEKALALWKGNVLENVRPGRRIQSYAVRLDELRIFTIQLKVSCEMRMGRNRETVSELRTLTEYHPLNEWFHGQLMSALAGAGRRGEALDVYQRLRSRLDDELGLEPSLEVKRFQAEILRGEQWREFDQPPVPPSA